jgi:hypothetical protein
MPRNITITFDDGSTHVYQNAPDDVTPEQVTQRAQQEFGKAVMQLDGGRKDGLLPEIGRVADKSLRGGLAALPGMIGDTILSGVKNLHKGAEVLPGGPGALLPGLTALQAVAEVGKAEPIQNTKFGDVTRTIETAGGILPPKSQPLTEGGKATANILEPAVATVAGGGAGSFWDKALIGMAGGGGGELAARLFGDNAFARLIGSVVGSGAAGVGTSLRSNAENIVRDSTKHVTPNDWRRAKVLEATLEKEQIPHVKSQLLGPRSTLDDTVAVAGTHPTVRPKLVTRVEGSSEAARKSYDRFASQNLPIDANERAQALHDVQGAAEAAIQVLRNKANTAYRGKMPPEGAEYPKEYVEAIRASLIDLAKSPKYGETSAAGKAIMRVADDLLLPGGKLDTSKANAVMLGRAQKAGQDLSAVPGVEVIREPLTNQHKINNLIKELNLKATKDDYKGLPIEDVKKMLKGLTPEFEAAREAKTTIMRAEVNPAQRGLTGQLAQMGGGLKPDKATAKETALQLVFPQDRLQPQAIVDLSKQIGGEGVGQLLREHLARNMEKSTALRASTGEQAQGPFRFVEAVAGTNAQRQNLEAALKVNAEALGANPQQVRTGFYKLMRAFESTKDLKLPGSVDRAALSQQAGATIPGFMVAPNSRLGRFFWEKATARTYDKIADMVLSKDGLAQLEAIARSPKPETARQVAISIMASTNAEDEKRD